MLVLHAEQRVERQQMASETTGFGDAGGGAGAEAGGRRAVREMRGWYKFQHLGMKLIILK